MAREIALCIHALHASSTTVEIARNVADHLGREGELKIDDRLEDHGLRAHDRYLEGFFARLLKGDVLGVYGVLLAVIDGDLNVFDGITGDDTL